MRRKVHTSVSQWIFFIKRATYNLHASSTYILKHQFNSKLQISEVSTVNHSKSTAFSFKFNQKSMQFLSGRGDIGSLLLPSKYSVDASLLWFHRVVFVVCTSNLTLHLVRYLVRPLSTIDSGLYSTSDSEQEADKAMQHTEGGSIVHSFIHSFIHSYIHSFFLSVGQSVSQSVSQFILTFINLFIHLLMD